MSASNNYIQTSQSLEIANAPIMPISSVVNQVKATNENVEAACVNIQIANVDDDLMDDLANIIKEIANTKNGTAGIENDLPNTKINTQNDCLNSNNDLVNNINGICSNGNEMVNMNDNEQTNISVEPDINFSEPCLVSERSLGSSQKYRTGRPRSNNQKKIAKLYEVLEIKSQWSIEEKRRFFRSRYQIQRQEKFINNQEIGNCKAIILSNLPTWILPRHVKTLIRLGTNYVLEGKFYIDTLGLRYPHSGKTESTGQSLIRFETSEDCKRIYTQFQLSPITLCDQQINIELDIDNKISEHLKTKPNWLTSNGSIPKKEKKQQNIIKEKITITDFIDKETQKSKSIGVLQEAQERYLKFLRSINKEDVGLKSMPKSATDRKAETSNASQKLSADLVEKTDHTAKEVTILKDSINKLINDVVEKTIHTAKEATILKDSSNTFSNDVVVKTEHTDKEATALKDTSNNFSNDLVVKTELLEHSQDSNDSIETVVVKQELNDDDFTAMIKEELMDVDINAMIKQEPVETEHDQFAISDNTVGDDTIDLQVVQPSKEIVNERDKQFENCALATLNEKDNTHVETNKRISSTIIFNDPPSSPTALETQPICNETHKCNCKVVHIKNLPTTNTLRILRELIKNNTAVQIEEKSFFVRLLRHETSLEPLGECLLRFTTHRDAKMVCDGLNRLFVKDKLLEASLSKGHKISSHEHFCTSNTKGHKRKLDRDGALPHAPEPKRTKYADGWDVMDLTQNYMCAEEKKMDTYGLDREFLKKINTSLPLKSTIFVKNLQEYVTEVKLYEIFSMAGHIRQLHLKYHNDEFGAKIEYDHPVEAIQAISMFDKQKLFDKPMDVIMDNTWEPRPLPSGLSSIGKGLGKNGEPIKWVTTNVALHEIYEILYEMGKVNKFENTFTPFSARYVKKANPLPVKADPPTRVTSTCTKSINQDKSETSTKPDFSTSMEALHSILEALKLIPFETNYKNLAEMVIALQNCPKGKKNRLKGYAKYPNPATKSKNQNKSGTSITPHVSTTIATLRTILAAQNLISNDTNYNDLSEIVNALKKTPKVQLSLMRAKYLKDNAKPAIARPNPNPNIYSNTQNVLPDMFNEYIGAKVLNSAPNVNNNAEVLTSTQNQNSLHRIDPNLPSSSWASNKSPSTVDTFYQGFCNFMQSFAANDSCMNPNAPVSPDMHFEQPIPPLLPQLTRNVTPNTNKTLHSAQNLPPLLPTPRNHKMLVPNFDQSTPYNFNPNQPFFNQNPNLHPNQKTIPKGPQTCHPSQPQYGYNKPCDRNQNIEEHSRDMERYLSTIDKGEAMASDMLVFTNLPPSVTSASLASKIREAGHLVFCEVTSKGRGIARFKTVEEATICLRLFDRLKADGHVIHVEYI